MESKLYNFVVGKSKNIYEYHDNNLFKKFFKLFEELKNKYKINFFFDLCNLVLSIASCCLYIQSTYYACIYHKSQFYLMFNVFIRVYFLIDFIFNILSKKTKWKSGDYIYILIEIITIMPYLVVRITVKFEENYSNFYYLLTNSLISLRIYRLEFLSKYIVSYLIYSYIVR